MQGGRSPDGRFEVRVALVPGREPSDYAIQVHFAKQAKRLFTLEDIGGYLDYPTAVERCRALWHASGEFVVVTDQGTRHSREIYVLAVSPEGVKPLLIPNFIQNALGRVNATAIDHTCVSTPVKWVGDDLCLTHHFSANVPEKGRIFYTCDVVLHLDHWPNMVPDLKLKHVSSPTPENG